MKACRHLHGDRDSTNTYAKCSDCGQEFAKLGDVWFYIDGWVRMDTRFFEDKA